MINKENVATEMELPGQKSQYLGLLLSIMYMQFLDNVQGFSKICSWCLDGKFLVRLLTYILSIFYTLESIKGIQLLVCLSACVHACVFLSQNFNLAYKMRTF